MTRGRFVAFIKTLCAWLVAAEIVFSPVIYLAVLNAIGPSTEYFEPWIEGQVTLGADGIYHAFLGDRIFVRYIVVRHKLNGNCLLHVYRYGERIGGPLAGTRVLLDYADLRFVGANELRRPRWPLAGLVLGYGVDKDDNPKMDEPLLPPGVDSQEFALYVVAEYRCNVLDYIFPRYLQGGQPDQTARVNIVIKRRP
ncbi:MAG: hypothetical protein KGL39_31325 [Patescibacteria group bacterium]|nr:hypothetical protein [Patescibacteria group bacterium]